MNIKDLRKAKGLTLTELASQVGVSAGTISRWESGEIANMRRDRIVLLAKALGVKPTDLLDLPNKEYKSQKQKRPTSTELSPKDEREINEKLESILSEMDSETGLAAFGGTIDDKEEIDLIKSSLKQALAIAKKAAKEKYTPKKHRK